MKRNYWLVPLSIIGGILIICRFTGILQYYSIPTGSNEPTIPVGGHLLASNLSKPKRFDFMCYHQAAGEGWPAGTWVKRVCGLPGDRIQLIDGVLFVNGRNADSSLNLKNAYIISARETQKLGDVYATKHSDDMYQVSADTFTVFLETAVLRKYAIVGRLLIEKDTTEIQKVFGHPWTMDNFGPIRVPPGRYFVLGDNRHQSADSRIAGFVDEKDYIGTVFKIF